MSDGPQWRQGTPKLRRGPMSQSSSEPFFYEAAQIEWTFGEQKISETAIWDGKNWLLPAMVAVKPEES